MLSAVTPELTDGPRVCRNCGQPLTGRYCAGCGQEDRPLAPSLRALVGDAWEALTSLEGRAFQSLGRLFFAPGFLTREYIEGRRVRWVSPVRLYIVVSVVYFGLTSLTGWGGVDFDLRVTGDSEVDAQEELQRLGFESQAEVDEAARVAVNTWLPRAMFLLVPIFAGLVGVARREAGRTYPQHLVFSLHVHAAVFGAFALAGTTSGLLGGPTFDSAIESLSLAYAVSYIVLAMRHVYGGSLRRSIVLGLVTGVTYGIVAIAVTIAILMPIALAWG